AALEADGYSVAGWKAAKGDAKPAALTPQAEFDASTLASNTDAGAYGVVQWFTHPATITPDLATAMKAEGQDAPQQQAALDRTLREGLAAVGIPRAAGAGTIELMSDTARKFAGRSEAEKTAMRLQAKAGVEAVYGPDASKEYTAVLQAWRTKNPALVDS